MTWPQKGMAVAAAGVLLGFGMCGVDRLANSQAGVMDRTLPLLGAATVALCAVLLLLCVLAWIVLQTREASKRSDR